MLHLYGSTIASVAQAGVLTALLLTSPAPLAAQSGAGHQGHEGHAGHAQHHPAARAATDDSAFARLNRRGAVVMGVDQAASVHTFERAPDGGRIRFVMRDSADLAGTAVIRAHLREIAADFTRGDFSKPFGVHAQTVPGTPVMAAKRAVIRYAVTDVPGGAELRMTTADAAARAAIAEFLRFQEDDHRAH
jgi:hypothetical protein